VELKRYVQGVVALPFEKEAQAPAFIYQGYQRLNLHTTTPDKRSLRIIVQDREALIKAPTLYFVGFFGTKKSQIEPVISDQLAKLDRTLIRHLEEVSPVLSYSSLELPDFYNYANLVLFSHPDSLKHWKKNNYQHRKASREVSPHYYQSVKIHFGVLESGLTSNFSWVSTTIYDFN
jgi:hypothetical protein